MEEEWTSTEQLFDTMLIWIGVLRFLSWAWKNDFCKQCREEWKLNSSCHETVEEENQPATRKRKTSELILNFEFSD
jgi:hypothetical protein